MAENLQDSEQLQSLSIGVKQKISNQRTIQTAAITSPSKCDQAQQKRISNSSKQTRDLNSPLAKSNNDNNLQDKVSMSESLLNTQENYNQDQKQESKNDQPNLSESKDEQEDKKQASDKEDDGGQYIPSDADDDDDEEDDSDDMSDDQSDDDGFNLEGEEDNFDYQGYKKFLEEQGENANHITLNNNKNSSPAKKKVKPPTKKLSTPKKEVNQKQE